MFILDTDVVSELRKARSKRANPGVAEWAEAILPSMMFMSVISLHELELGVLLAERRDPEQGRRLRTWLDAGVAPAFQDRILPVTVGISRRAAALHVSDHVAFRDALVAATARHHDMVLVTRNTRYLEHVAGLQIKNPWT